jgi:hypothetical protein
MVQDGDCKLDVAKQTILSQQLQQKLAVCSSIRIKHARNPAGTNLRIAKFVYDFLNSIITRFDLGNNIPHCDLPVATNHFINASFVFKRTVVLGLPETGLSEMSLLLLLN